MMKCLANKEQLDRIVHDFQGQHSDTQSDPAGLRYQINLYVKVREVSEDLVPRDNPLALPRTSFPKFALYFLC